MEPDDLQSLIDSVTFKKTTYIRPHEYIVRGWNPHCKAIHEAISQLIAQDGYESRFYNRTYRYVNIDGFKYWVMDDVLNREKLEREDDSGS